MSDWEKPLRRWVGASLLTQADSERIRDWEESRAPEGKLAWPVVAAIAFGVVLLGAGVLLFVSAHWDRLSPSARMALVCAMVGGFHAGAAYASTKFPALEIGLHTLGTLSLGAGIALGGQIFHLASDWGAGMLLWAMGSWLAWAILRHWPQLALAIFLTAGWVMTQWGAWFPEARYVVYAGLSLLAVVFMSLRSDSLERRVLHAIGTAGLLPMAAVLIIGDSDRRTAWNLKADLLPWAFALGTPLALGIAIRRSKTTVYLAATVIAVLLSYAASWRGNPWLYLVCGVAAVLLAAWGVQDARPERINLGFAAFALSVIAFFFSSVMDRLGRSASLIVLGILFLGGGWWLERWRRRLIEQVRGAAVDR
ncbi:MAG: DUF2157 domain-containing protein [Pirellulaceae bacterium]|nr:DUF2157 domain-containing protein [Pirellulaceae bacterium]